MLNPIEAKKLRDTLLEVVELLDKALTNEGCIHEDRTELTTMGGTDRRTFLCNSCDQELEEVFGDQING